MQFDSSVIGPGISTEPNRDGLPQAAALRQSMAQLARFSGEGLTSLLLLVTLVLCWRRASGALATPLPVLETAVVALAMVAFLVTIRCVQAARRPLLTSVGTLVRALVLSAIALLLAGTLTMPGSPHQGLVVLWGLLAAEELWAWMPRPLRHATVAIPATQDRREDMDPAVSTGLPLPAAKGETEPPTAGVLQQLTRAESADGTDRLSGWLRVPLEPSQRIANLHVAFCPPFSRSPVTSVEQADGPKVRVKTVQVLPFGARFDLKVVDRLDATADTPPSAILLRFAAEVGHASTDEAPGPAD